LAEEIDEIKARIENHEKRLSALESKHTEKLKNSTDDSKDYSGLVGGIRYLIDNGFFNEPKTVKETLDELKRKGYHYGDAAVSKALSVTFTRKTKVLNRIKEGDVYKYVIRK